jgi:hypothetical protein
MATAPYVGKDATLRSLVANVTYNMNTPAFTSNRARCVRGYTLQAIQNQARASTLSQNVANTFSAAKSAMSGTGKLIRDNRADVWFTPVLSAYLRVGKEAAQVAGQITASSNTRASMYSAMMC